MKNRTEKPIKQNIDKDTISQDIPVLSVTKEGFCRRKDKYSYREVTCNILEFFDRNPHNKFRNTVKRTTLFCELVKNSYDSYATRKFKPNKFLKIKSVINKNTHNTVFKIKDNGIGFKHKSENKHFTIDEIQYQTKGMEHGFVGGQGRGLKLFEHYVNNLGGQLFLKNRKAGGASIEMIFPNEVPGNENKRDIQKMNPSINNNFKKRRTS